MKTNKRRRVLLLLLLYLYVRRVHSAVFAFVCFVVRRISRPTRIFRYDYRVVFSPENRFVRRKLCAPHGHNATTCHGHRHEIQSPVRFVSFGFFCFVLFFGPKVIYRKTHTPVALSARDHRSGRGSSRCGGHSAIPSCTHNLTTSVVVVVAKRSRITNRPMHLYV